MKHVGYHICLWLLWWNCKWQLWKGWKVIIHILWLIYCILSGDSCILLRYTTVNMAATFKISFGRKIKKCFSPVWIRVYKMHILILLLMRCSLKSRLLFAKRYVFAVWKKTWSCNYFGSQTGISKRLLFWNDSVIWLSASHQNFDAWNGDMYLCLFTRIAEFRYAWENAFGTITNYLNYLNL